MLTKHKYEKVIKKYLEPLKKKMNIKSKVNIHVYDSQAKKYQKLMPGSTKDRSRHEYGYTFVNSKGQADIFLFYDRQKNEKEGLGTLVHELLHVVIAPLSGLVTFKLGASQKTEEKIVRQLEQLLIDLMWDGTL